MGQTNNLHSVGCLERLRNSPNYQDRYSEAVDYLDTGPTARAIQAEGAPLAREYSSWRGARSGKGRAPMCPSLYSFKDFIRIHGPMPSAEGDWKLDRIDNDMGYTPSNIRWSSPTESTRNRTNTLSLRFHGHDLFLVDAARVLGISYSAVHELFARDKGQIVARLERASFRMKYAFPEPFSDELEAEYQKDARGLMRLHWILEFAWIEACRLLAATQAAPDDISLRVQYQNANSVYTHAQRFHQWAETQLSELIKQRTEIREAGPLPAWEIEAANFRPQSAPEFCT